MKLRHTIFNRIDIGNIFIMVKKNVRILLDGFYFYKLFKTISHKCKKVFKKIQSFLYKYNILKL